MKYLNIFLLFFSLTLFCSCPKDDSPVEETVIKPITYELLSFVFTPQTNSNEDALSYEIEFFNSNNFEVKGFPQVTLTIEGGATATSVPNNQCTSISANSSCVLSYSVVDDNPNLFPVEPIEFVAAEYVLMD
ncbi:hypothetical protein N1F78_15275 [Seonamhaeicola sp. MEBiC1930]|uniref:hypothetical protein n=1 Tax=Seonamhaeicola sp. MEBiC01930 TaxID=2976768 RepID=UPI003255BAE6